MARNHVEINSTALTRQLQRAMRRNPTVTTKTVRDIALDLAGRSARRAPVESGDLRNNCVAKINNAVLYENQAPTGKEPLPSVKVSGTVGYSLPYALRQHEDMSLPHRKTNGKIVNHTIRFKTDDGKIHKYQGASSVNKVAGGEAKFLENPYLENEERYIRKLKAIPEEVFE